jgi:periplasmic protein TonB
MPRLRFQIKPEYPFVAREMQIEGYVDIEFIVNSDGSVSDIKILQNSPSNIFDRSAENTVGRWKFTPGKIQGEPVTSRVSVRIEFKLD